MRTRLLATAASQIFARVASSGARVLMTFAAIRILGAGQYASWLLASALGLYVTQTLGVPQTMVDIAARNRTGDHAPVAAALWHACALLSGTALVLSTAVFVVGKHSGVDQPTTHLFALCVLVGAISLPLAPLRGIAEGFQDAPALNLVVAAGAILGAAVAIAGIIITQRAAWLLGPMVGSHLIAPCVYIPRMLTMFPALSRRPAWSWAMLADIVRPSLWFCVIGIAWTAIYATDVWVLQLSGLAPSIAAYGLAFSLFSALAEPLAAIVSALRPIVGGIADRPIRASVYTSSVRCAFTASAFCNGLGLLAYPLLILLWGSGRIEPMVDVALVLVAYQTLRATVDPSAWLVVPLRGPRILATSLSIDAVVNVSFSLLLARWLGPLGVAVGTLLGTLLGSAQVLPRVASREFGTASGLRSGSIALAFAWWMACALVALGQVSMGWRWIGVCAAAALLAPLGGLAFWWFALKTPERELMLSLLARLRPRSPRVLPE